MPKKIRELKSMLRRAGFVEQSGKGSHVNFWHPAISGTFVTISGNDGHDARKYHEKEVAEVIDRARRGLKSGSQQ
jgi:predicted RNA binding protein YcfA (HicA-like mRNA interferase family)